MPTIICIILSLLFFSASSTAFGADRYIKISIYNETPAIEAQPEIQIFPQPPILFTKTAPNHFEYNFKLSDEEWFNRANIKITWKKAYLNAEGKTGDFEQRIILRLRREFPAEFSFPIHFSNNRTQSEMWRLEHLKDINDQFEVFFRSWQIASYYRDTNGVSHPLTKRAANIFFYSAVKLAEEPKYFVIMSDEAEQFANEAFGAERKLSDRANLARSFYWEDLRYIDTLVSQKKCKEAQLLLSALQALRSSEASLFEARFRDSIILGEKEKIFVSGCKS